MIQYRCDVIDSEGKRSFLLREAANENACVRELVSEGVTPIKLHTGKPGLAEILNRPVQLGGEGGSASQAIFLRQLAILVKADLPVDRSLDLFQDQATSRSQRQMMKNMLVDIRSGQSLAQALEGASVFPAWTIGIIRAAETGGNLGEALGDAADRMAAIAKTRRDIIGALAYPAAVLIATIIALIVILTLVVPQFAPLFAGAEDKLPTLTRGVLVLSENLASWSAGVLIGPAILLVLGYVFLKSQTGAKMREAHPGLFPGQRLRDRYLAARFSGLFSTLLLSGVNTVRAFKLASDAMPSQRWRRQLGDALLRVREGERISASLGKASAFPDTARRLIEVGEKTGRLGETCREASVIIGDAAKQRIEMIVSLVNPVAIILLGGIVALLVAGVMLGIFSLGDFAG